MTLAASHAAPPGLVSHGE